MYEIYVDATNRYEKKVILEKDKKPVAEKAGDIDLVSSLATLLREQSLSLQDISAFRSNTGPGSFTGIKIGVTIANTINWAMGKKDIADLEQPHYGAPPNITPRKKR